MRKLSTAEYKNISTAEINKAVANFVDELNLVGGSTGGFNLYTLLTTYIRDESKRREINALLKIAGDASDYTI